jgi:LytS/YehU family sensor histidine kinase
MGVLTATVLSLIYCVIRTFLAPHANDFPVGVIFHQMFLQTFSASFLLFANLAALGVAAKYFRVSRSQMASETNLRELLRGRYLSALTAQIRPHFLFNALNSTCALLHSDRVRAERMLAGTRTFLSNVISHDGSHFVPLREELRTLEIYLEMEAAGRDSELRWSLEIPADAWEMPVPLMILQPLAENAIRHGMPAGGGPVFIRIFAEVAGDGKLILRLANSPIGPAHRVSPRKGMGIGIGNTRSRLAILYGGAAEFSLDSTPPGGATATLTLPGSIPAEPPQRRDGWISDAVPIPSVSDRVAIPSFADRPDMWSAFIGFWVLDGAFSSYLAYELGPPGWALVVFSGVAEAVSWGTTTLGAYWAAFRIRPTLAAAPKLCAVILGLYMWQQITSVSLLWPAERRWSPLIDQLQTLPTVLTYISVAVLVGYGVRHFVLVQQREPVLQELWVLSRDAEVSRLRTELDPSFLIDALDETIALLRADPQEADLRLTRIGDFLRVALRRSQSRCVSLHEEIEFIQRYVQLGAGGQNLNMVINAEPHVLSWEVPRLVLLPLLQLVLRDRSLPPLRLQARMLNKQVLSIRVTVIAPPRPSLARETANLAEVLNRVTDARILYAVEAEKQKGDFHLEILVTR